MKQWSTRLLKSYITKRVSLLISFFQFVGPVRELRTTGIEVKLRKEIGMKEGR